MEIEAGKVYHIYNQGNNRRLIFYIPENYLFFLKRFRRITLPYADVLAYCLMPNHFHFLLMPNQDGEKRINVGNVALSRISNGFRCLLSSYSQAVNKQQGISGSLFRQKTKSKLLEEVSATVCFHYIHQNPMKAGYVRRMEDWQYSSFADYVGKRQGTLCNQRLAYQLLLLNSERFYKEAYGVISEENRQMLKQFVR